MRISTHASCSGRYLLSALLVIGIGLVAPVLSGCGGQADGRDVRALAEQTSEPGIEAYFTRESYATSDRARLVVGRRTRGVTMQVFRTGTVWPDRRRRNEMYGTPVTERLPLARRISIGDWPSGVYYVELREPDGTVGYAPFIVRPRRLGEHRVAVVMPTNTWQAYNRRDSDGDGEGDTWYENWGIRTIDTTRPFLDRGVPPHFGRYDLPFLHWLTVTGKEVDFLSDRELHMVRGNLLRKAYDLIVFPGHHEYVTSREYDAIERYRDLGGNLMFLSANNFFWRVDRRGDRLRKVAQWRDLGRPEASLIGVQYVANDRGRRQGPYIVRASGATEWIFNDTPLLVGSTFGSFGIEIDATSTASPDSTEVVAEIPHLLAGKTAQMSYYETGRGARVFAAGAFTLAGSALDPRVSQVLKNIWEHLTADRGLSSAS